MGSRDRPGHNVKKKPKSKLQQVQPAPTFEQPMSVELIRKKRKPRSEPGTSTED